MSATLQWSYLDAGAKAGGVVPPALVEWLDGRLASASEDYSIRVRLARERGHQRLGSFDDHHDADLPSEAFHREWEARQADQHFLNHPVLAQESCDLLGLYQALNTTQYGRELTDFEWNDYLRLNWPSGLHRLKVVQWEVRNLLMAAHLRRLTTAHPGGRVLAVVGANHKRLLDRYLSTMLDGRVVQFGGLNQNTRPILGGCPQ